MCAMSDELPGAFRRLLAPVAAQDGSKARTYPAEGDGVRLLTDCHVIKLHTSYNVFTHYAILHIPLSALRSSFPQMFLAPLPPIRSRPTEVANC